MNNEAIDTWSSFDLSIKPIETEPAARKTTCPYWSGRKKEPVIIMQDNAVAIVLNEAEEALVLADPGREQSWSSWRMLNGELSAEEDPLAAIQRQLRQTIGYESMQWIYLGTFVADDRHNEGANHYFLAKQARPISDLDLPLQDGVRWVPVKNLRTAVLDGRVALVNHAMTITLALLTVLH